LSQHRCVRMLRRSAARGACARGTPVGWVAFLRIVLAAPRGAVDGNAVAKGVEKIRDEMIERWEHSGATLPDGMEPVQRESVCMCPSE
jgi:hypothetical protein